MMNTCKSNQWSWAYDILREQGRMHQTIMQFPSDQFYDGALKVLQQPEMKRELEKQLTFKTDPHWTGLLLTLSRKRMIYIPSPTDNQGKSKINRKEAELVVTCIQSIYQLYHFNDKPIHSHTIGVITPYRAQIAQIRKSLQDKRMSPDDLSIDTVERYQGGARDIIILSLCTNRFSQIQNMISLSDDGVDRKLNVALTRARHQLIIIGNEEILEAYPVYKSLIAYCRTEGQN